MGLFVLALADECQAVRASDRTLTKWQAAVACGSRRRSEVPTKASFTRPNALCTTFSVNLQRNQTNAPRKVQLNHGAAGAEGR